jgi:hypothetical protein
MKTLQYYNSLYNNIHQSKSAEVLHNISLQTIYFKPYKLYVALLQTILSGVTLVTLLQHPSDVPCLRAKHLLIDTDLENRHAARPKQTCS